ncbi:hypothetical protein CI610_00549 [invertebrate metagenome]|uniref:Uncharacterized protein n=1 Tax=invertebrate metagenome TaxID=1711999 RepID=A0A2H9TB39_9ZZZZ
MLFFLLKKIDWCMAFSLVFFPFSLVYSTVEIDNPYIFKSYTVDKTTKNIKKGCLILVWRETKSAEKWDESLMIRHQQRESKHCDFDIDLRKKHQNHKVSYFNSECLKQLMESTYLEYLENSGVPSEHMIKAERKSPPSNTDPVLLPLRIMSEEIRKMGQKVLREKSKIWSQTEDDFVEHSDKSDHRCTKVCYRNEKASFYFTKKNDEENLRCCSTKDEEYVLLDISTDVLVLSDSLGCLNFPVFSLDNCKIKEYSSPKERLSTVSKNQVIEKWRLINDGIDPECLESISDCLWCFEFKFTRPEENITVFPIICFYLQFYEEGQPFSGRILQMITVENQQSFSVYVTSSDADIQ